MNKNRPLAQLAPRFKGSETFESRSVYSDTGAVRSVNGGRKMERALLMACKAQLGASAQCSGVLLIISWGGFPRRAVSFPFTAAVHVLYLLRFINFAAWAFVRPKSPCLAEPANQDADVLL